MIARALRLAGAALCFALPCSLAGQVPLSSLTGPTRADNRGEDGAGSHLNWGSADVLVRATPFLGLKVAAYTISRDRDRPPRGFAGSFIPDSALAWINVANGVVHPSGDPHDTNSALATPALRDAAGDSMLLVRRAERGHWEKRISIVLASARPGREPFAIAAKPNEVEALLNAMLREGTASGFSSDSASGVASGSALLGPHDVVIPEAEADTPPTLLQAGRFDWPDHSLSGIIEVEFVVDETGLPVESSIRTVSTDHPEFERWARPLILGSRFRPGFLRGRAVPVIVRQRIHYSSN